LEQRGTVLVGGGADRQDETGDVGWKLEFLLGRFERERQRRVRRGRRKRVQVDVAALAEELERRAVRHQSQQQRVDPELVQQQRADDGGDVEEERGKDRRAEGERGVE